MPQVFIGIVLGACIAIGSYFARFLNLKGSFATFLLASVIFGAGGWQWTLPILVFFVSSSLLSKTGKLRKRQFDSVFEKSDVRDHGQVLANGGIGGLLAVAQMTFPTADFYQAYVGSVAAVTADTWGTEIGLLSKGKTYSIVSFAAVRRGSNGGISLLGMAGAVLGAAAIVFSTASWIQGFGDLPVALTYGVKVVAAGVLGSLVDSFLGATIQAEYKCVVCGTKTERSVHCESPAKLVRGWKWINNDVVNWSCALTGAGAMVLQNF